jgi:hypothetical protein
MLDGDRPESWLHGPVDHWVEELVRLARELRFDDFMLWPDHDDVLGQTERFAAEVVPAARERLGPGDPSDPMRSRR